jgi:hypothetical protein
LTPEEQRPLETLFGKEVAEMFEGGRRLIILPKVVLPAGCAPAEAFGIYVASQYGGYDTKLFFEKQITAANGTIPPTTTDILFGRTMHGASFNGVSATLPPHEGILAHLTLYEAKP